MGKVIWCGSEDSIGSVGADGERGEGPNGGNSLMGIGGWTLVVMLLSACDCGSTGSPDALVDDAMVDGDSGAVEICGNGVDDDGNGAVDCEDLACIGLSTFDEALLSRTTDRPFLERVRFLWEGHDGASECPPIQQGVAPGTLERRDVAAVNGRVTDEDGEPLSDIRVDVLDHPEIGYTLTRGDGAFDLAVPPVGQLVLRFRSTEGIETQYISAQRAVFPRPQTYSTTTTVALVAQPPVAMVDLTTGGEVIGEMASDEDGQRQASVLFPAGMAATVIDEDGREANASSLAMRIREFTVGGRGLERMVAPLPAASGYTYAIELGVSDQSMGGDGTGSLRASFDQPVPVYVDDFLGMPIATAVPVGSYDRQLGRWVPEEDGLVVALLGTEGRGDGALALLDVDGDGRADDSEALGALGIDAEERRALARAHRRGAHPLVADGAGPGIEGARLWRFAPDHFSAWDLNWPFAFPSDAIPPSLGTAEGLAGLAGSLLGADAFLEDSCAPGSQIRVQRQILGEQVGVVGTGMALHYASDRHPAYTAGRTIELQITPDEIPASLQEVRIELDVAGQSLRRSRAPEPADVFRFVWDGEDRFGRRFRGPATYTLRVGYVYEGDYTTAGAAGGGIMGSGGRSFGLGGGERIEGSRTREEIVAWQEVHGILRYSDVTTDGLLGLTLSAHHRYDPLSESLLMGNGQTVRGAAVPRVMERIGGLEGSASSAPAMEGDIATEVDFEHVTGVAVDAAGRIHFSARREHRIWRIELDGTLALLAGTGDEGMTGDGGPARDAAITSPSYLAFGPDGALYFTSNIDSSATTRVIRRVRPDGIIETFAGNGERGDAEDAVGDGLLAKDAPLERPSHLAFAADGTLYFLDGLSTVRTVDPGGRLRTLNPRVMRMARLDDDGTPLSLADLGSLGAMAVDVRSADETLYVGTLDGRVFQVGADRRIQRIAGGGAISFEDGIDVGPQDARTAMLRGIRALAVGAAGEVWIVDSAGNRLLRWAGGLLTRAAGGVRPALPSGNGGPAASAVLSNVRQISVDDENRLLIADAFPSDQIRRIRAGFGARRSDEWVIPSPDGTLRFVFDLDGHHQRTETALTGSSIHSFDYDGEGRLRSLTDAHDNTLTILHGDSVITVAPTEGPRTQLYDEDGDGYVDRVATDGDDHETRMGWREGGLLTSFVDRIGVAHAYDYDDQGRLTSDGIVGMPAQRLERIGSEVTLTTAGGRAASWGAARGDDEGPRRQRYTDASGVFMERTLNDEGVETTRYGDGSEIEVTYRPDAVLGAGVRVPIQTVIRTPAGRESRWTLEQESTLRGVSGVGGAGVGAELEERTTTITTNVGTDREASTTERLVVMPDGSSRFEMTSAEGRQGWMVRNERGELIEIAQPGRYPVHLTYDAHGRLLSATQGPPVEDGGRPEDARTLSWTLPTIPSESFGDVEVEDATGRMVSASFDGRGRPQEVRDGLRAASFSYDEAARSFGVSPPGRDRHSFSYDDRGFLAAYDAPSVPPVGSGGDASSEGDQSFEFDDDGVAQRMLWRGGGAAGPQVELSVDDAFRGRGATFSGADGGAVGAYESAVDFDDVGDVSALRWRQPVGEVRSRPTYDGPLLTEAEVVIDSLPISGAGGAPGSGDIVATVTPTYDDALEARGLTVGVDAMGGGGAEQMTVLWDFDEDGLVNALSLESSTAATAGLPGGVVAHDVTLSLDAASGDINVMRGGSARSSFGTDGFGAPELASHRWTGPAGSVSFTLAYERDRAGRIQALDEDGAASSAFDYDFSYDDAGRLIRVSTGGGPGVERYGYDYDTNGNRVGWRSPDGGCDAGADICTEYDGQDRLLRYGRGAMAITYRYNSAGQRTLRTGPEGTTRYDYDILGHLNGVELPDGRYISYLHDASGSIAQRRIGSSMEDGERTAAWLGSGGRILAQLDADGRIEVLYAYVEKSWVPDWAIHRDGRLFRVISDHVGSVRRVVDVSSGGASRGEVVQSYRYSPFGVLEEDITIESIVPHRFAGGHYDPDTGLLRFGARDYDPQIGRWTNKDPLGFAAGDPNLYAYVSGDPVNGVDPSGLFVDTLTDGIAVAGCAFALARDNIFGSCDNLSDNLTDCALAAGAFVLPFVSYGALKLGSKLGRRLRRAPDLPCGSGVCPCFVAGTPVAVTGDGDETEKFEESRLLPIDEIQVGDRVLTAPSSRRTRDAGIASFSELAERSCRNGRSEVSPYADWNVYEVELSGERFEDGGGSEVNKTVALTVLRPLEWLDEIDPDGDGSFWLQLDELRLQGLAHLVRARGPPSHLTRSLSSCEMQAGRVVLATVRHHADAVLSLWFTRPNSSSDFQPGMSGYEDPIQTTPNHPFYSVVRGWIPAGDLEQGEEVETVDGVLILAGSVTDSRSQEVFNLQVEGDHEYLVGQQRIRVHNTYPGGGSGSRPWRAGQYHGPKPSYTNPGHHDPSSGVFRGGGSRTSVLPSDAEEVYRSAIPDQNGVHWYGRSRDGEIYIFRNGNDGTVHWAGSTGTDRGLQIPRSVRRRFRSLDADRGGR